MIDVMIIDDDTTVRESLKDKIEWEALQLRLVCEAADSDTARELYLIHRPKIIITDICIPIISGLELAEELAKLDSYIRFIVITGFNDFEYAQKSVRLGAVDLLSKPIFPEEINASLVRAIRFFSEQKDKFNEAVRNIHLSGELQILQQVFVKDLLTGRLRDRRLISEKIGLLRLQLDAPRFAVAIIEPISSDGRVPDRDRDVALLNTIQEDLSTEGLQTVCYTDDDGRISCMLSTDVENPDNMIEDRLSQLQDHLQFSTNRALHIGIGQTVTDLLQLPKSRTEALIALNYQQLVAESTIIHYKNIRHFEMHFPDTDSLESHLMLLLRGNKFNELIVTVENYAFMLSTRSVDGLHRLSDFCLNYLAAVIKTALAMRLEFTQLERDRISISELNKIASPMRQLQYVLSATQRLLIALFGNQKNKGNYLVEQAKIYISHHLSDPNLCLDSVSDAIGLSKIYFCKLFHKEEKISFSNYVKNARLAQAKKLLLQTTMRVCEISDAVGFASGKYFGYVFKRETGMTPLEYQKANFIPDVATPNALSAGQ